MTRIGLDFTDQGSRLVLGVQFVCGRRPPGGLVSAVGQLLRLQPALQTHDDGAAHPQVDRPQHVNLHQQTPRVDPVRKENFDVRLQPYTGAGGGGGRG